MSKANLRWFPVVAAILMMLPAVIGSQTGTVTPKRDVKMVGKLESDRVIATDRVIQSQKSITIESSGDNVVITAGSSQITVSPSGGVTIATQDVTINAVNTLTLSAGNKVAIEAPIVDIHAVARLDLRSDAMTTVEAGTSANLNGSATVDINGGMVYIN